MVLGQRSGPRTPCTREHGIIIASRLQLMRWRTDNRTLEIAFRSLQALAKCGAVD